MNHINICIRLPIIVLISISFGILLSSSTSYSQSYLRIDEDIGGGSNGFADEEDNSGNTLIFVGAVIVIGVIAYLLITHKSKEEKSDYDASSSIYDSNLVFEFNDIDHKIEKVKDSIPIDLFIGIRNERSFISDKTYLMGVSIKF
ncbi:MAG: hypothetical protein O6940_12740 [Ignavibacteria bacterium]|nr:hypothetical protein [Ignavibacteria bacterium]